MTTTRHRPREPPATAPGITRTNLTDQDDQERTTVTSMTRPAPSAWHARPIREW